jgi:hypothetical protein
MRVSSLDWMAQILAGLGCSFWMRTPESRDSIRTLAGRLLDSAA